MGVRSDVVLAIREKVWNKLDEEYREKMFAEFNYRFFDDEGTLIIWKDYKWYPDEEPTSSIVSWLQDLDPEDFRILVATPEYPTDDSCDMGEWFDNPWNTQKHVTCKLSFETE
jgi:hypothetical protein